MARETEIYQATVHLADCPYCEARMIVEILHIGAKEAHPLVCEACGKDFVGVYPENPE